MAIPLSRYREEGCESREEYLQGLADDHGLTLDEVMAVADMLGPNEDFDGLVTTLEDGAHLIRENGGYSQF